MPHHSGALAILLTFSITLIVLVGIGLLSSLKSRKNNKDYLLAGSDVAPWLVALSAVATNNSGYMFIGLIGWTYVAGLSAIWLMFGWIFGDFCASLFIHRRIRLITERQGVLSFMGVISEWYRPNFRHLRFIGGLVAFVFLGVYGAAQLSAGGKALHVLLGWSNPVGILMGAVIVFLYCYAGGIRASIWTDAAQSVLMIFGMLSLFVYGIYHLGGIASFIGGLQSIGNHYLSIVPRVSHFGIAGPLLFIISWIVAGVAVIGQPQIMVRFMAMDKASSIAKIRFYYYGFYITFSAMTYGVAMVARLTLNAGDGFDPELALPLLASAIFHPVMTGMVLAGIFAATISTADSLILSCSAALTQDIIPASHSNPKVALWFTKLATLFATICATLIAIYGNQSVFQLAVLAWAVLGTAFTPILITYVLSPYRPRESTLVAMLVSGLVTLFVWRHFGLNETVYEVFPAMVASFIAYFVCLIWDRKPKAGLLH